MMRLALAGALLLGATGLIPALAQDQVTGPAGVATLSPAARGAPALRAFLEEEAQGLLDSAAAEGLRVRMVDRDRFVSARYISLTRRTTGYGPEQIEALTWDRGQRRFVGLTHFLIGRGGTPDYIAISTALRGALRQSLGAAWPVWADRVTQATAPDPTVLQNFTLQGGARASGLVFHFSEGEVGPKPVSIAVPARVFAQYLKSDVKAQFSVAP